MSADTKLISESCTRREPVVFEARLTAYRYTMFDGTESIVAELRRIADALENDTLGESGSMTYADFGTWRILDPFQKEGKKPSTSGL